MTKPTVKIKNLNISTLERFSYSEQLNSGNKTSNASLINNNNAGAKQIIVLNTKKNEIKRNPYTNTFAPWVDSFVLMLLNHSFLPKFSDDVMDFNNDIHINIDSSCICVFAF